MKETFPLHKYLRHEQQASAFVKGYVHTVEVGVICPSCYNQLALIEHGKSLRCTCGIKLTVWGNTLELSNNIFS